MAVRAKIAASVVRINLRARTAALVSLALLAAILTIVPIAQSQTFTILHNFTGNSDGGQPTAGLTMDAAGNLYGTTTIGGQSASNCYGSCGTVFRLKKEGEGWVLNSLYQFRGGDDGANPQQKVVFGPDGTLYGLTWTGGGGPCPTGNMNGCGTVYNLRPSPTACANVLCPWTESVIYRFAGGAYDGASPGAEPTFDSAGNMYGTTNQGGISNRDQCVNVPGYTCGTVFKMVPSNGAWTESLIYLFSGQADGSNPNAGITLDASGNLYSTASENGYNGGGTVFELMPSSNGWTESALYSFSYTTGDSPRYGLIFDPEGNMYGSTPFGGPYDGGAVFELQPSSGGWGFTPLYNFSGGSQLTGAFGDLVRDSEGNLYGTTLSVGDDHLGMVFELSPTMNGWTLNVLHQFTGVKSDGAVPVGGVVRDAQGNLYGTAQSGGTYNQGVIWKITP